MGYKKSSAWKYAWEGITYRLKNPDMHTGGSCDVRYCYSVWMRHLIFYHEIKKDIPCTVAEFGPGDTIGTGLIALLCGVEEYYALDFTHYGGMQQIDVFFNQLLNMILQKSDIPDDTEYPDATPKLKSYKFPAEILTDEILDECLKQDRVRKIRESIQRVKRGKDSKMIHYLAPWWKEDIGDVKCDLIFSQAVFEHIDEYKQAHQVIGNMAKQGAVVSHSIDFACHMCANRWNGHWAYDTIMWKMVYGSRPYFLNRVPLDEHIKAMQLSGVKIKKVIRTLGKDGIERKELCRECRNISERDFVTQNAYVVGVKECNEKFENED